MLLGVPTLLAATTFGGIAGVVAGPAAARHLLRRHRRGAGGAGQPGRARRAAGPAASPPRRPWSALTRFASSVCFGLLWQFAGRAVGAAGRWASALAVAVPVAAWLLRAAAAQPDEPDRDDPADVIAVAGRGVGAVCVGWPAAYCRLRPLAGRHAAAAAPAGAVGRPCRCRPRARRRRTWSSATPRSAATTASSPRSRWPTRRGARAMLDLSCERVYATAARRRLRDRRARHRPDLRGRRRSTPSCSRSARPPLAGLPSRARMSPRRLAGRHHDLRHRPLLRPVVVLHRDRSSGATARAARQPRDLDRRPGRRPAARPPSNRNFWGVTFAADDDTFYATGAPRARRPGWCAAASGERTHDRAAHRRRVPVAVAGRHPGRVQEAAGQPDARASGGSPCSTSPPARETLLAETRSVDDQVEWLDDDRLLYALPRPGSEATTSDVWQVPADGSGRAAMSSSSTDPHRRWCGCRAPTTDAAVSGTHERDDAPRAVATTS